MVLGTVQCTVYILPKGLYFVYRRNLTDHTGASFGYIWRRGDRSGFLTLWRRYHSLVMYSSDAPQSTLICQMSQMLG